MRCRWAEGRMRAERGMEGTRSSGCLIRVRGGRRKVGGKGKGAGSERRKRSREGEGGEAESLLRSRRSLWDSDVVCGRCGWT